MDLLVIGSGVAGCAAALEAAARGKRVTVLTKAAADPLRENNSYWAQGGIIYKSTDPSEASLLAADIKRAGAGRCREDAVAKLANEGPAAMEALLLGPESVSSHTSSFNTKYQPQPIDSIPPLLSVLVLVLN